MKNILYFLIKTSGSHVVKASVSVPIADVTNEYKLGLLQNKWVLLQFRRGETGNQSPWARIKASAQLLRRLREDVCAFLSLQMPPGSLALSSLSLPKPATSLSPSASAATSPSLTVSLPSFTSEDLVVTLSPPG